MTPCTLINAPDLAKLRNHFIAMVTHKRPAAYLPTVLYRESVVMNENAVSLSAKQPPSFPLLRRPRPPPRFASLEQQANVTTVTSATTTRRKEVLLSSEISQEKLRVISTPTHPLPRHHPTPLSPHRHSHTHNLSPSPMKTHGEEGILDRDSIITMDDSYMDINPVYLRRGPQFFPARKTKLNKSKKRRCKKLLELSNNVEELNLTKCVLPEGEEAHSEDCDESMYEPPPTKLRGRMVSLQNYLKLTGWFTKHVPQQDTLNTLDITVDWHTSEGRRPHHQILLELKTLVDKVIEESASIKEDRQEEGGGGGGDEEVMNKRWPTPSPGDIVFRSSTSRYFCGQGRSDSPFDGGGQPLISPSEVAILESMIDGGYRLSLKAHFLSSLPLLSPLFFTLTHLNISFNSLTSFPAEILQLSKLQSLRMRNNPIQEIPDDIFKLEKLEDFCISFNLLTFLPSGLFNLPSLIRLDVSHNAIQSLSADISNLKTLQRLNIESNELIGSPLSLLSLPLTHLLISGNYLHPILWEENCRTPVVKTLIDSCCTTIATTLHNTRLPSNIQDILNHRKHPHVICDSCKGPIFGEEMKMIKSVKSNAETNFPLKSIPVLFIVCSQSCKAERC